MPAPLKLQLAELNSYNLEFQRLTEAGGLAAPDSLMATLPSCDTVPDRTMLEEIDAQYGKADALPSTINGARIGYSTCSQSWHLPWVSPT